MEDSRHYSLEDSHTLQKKSVVKVTTAYVCSVILLLSVLVASFVWTIFPTF